MEAASNPRRQGAFDRDRPDGSIRKTAKSVSRGIERLEALADEIRPAPVLAVKLAHGVEGV